MPAQAATPAVTTWSALKAAFQAGGTNTVVLGADISVTGDSMTLAPGDNMILDLNGHSLSIDVSNVNLQGNAAQPAAVGVPLGSSLTIDATGGGHLSAHGAKGSMTSNYLGGGAGIGGAGGEVDPAGNTTLLISPQSCGTLTINGGVIQATGGQQDSIGASDAPGIGGGSVLFATVGDGCAITVNGGNVTATGGAPYSSVVNAMSAAIGTSSMSQANTGATAGSMVINGTPVGSLAPAGNGWLNTSASYYTYYAAGVAVTPTATGSSSTTFTMSASTASLTGGATAQFQLTNFAVTVNDGMTAPTTQTLAFGATPVLNTPTRAGYTFGGWAAGSAAGPLFPSGGIITGPLSLYAVWTATSGGSGSNGSSGSGASLPSTGSDAALPVGLVALALLGGAAAIVLNRRRSHHG